jgi:hypothetical protein
MGAAGLLEHDDVMVLAGVGDATDVAVAGGCHRGLLRAAGPAPCRDPVKSCSVSRSSWPRGAAPWLDLLVGFRVAAQEVSVPDGSTPVGEVVVA